MQRGQPFWGRQLADLFRVAARHRALFCCLLVSVVSCRPLEVDSSASHLILVTIDTLRADHVGAYGGTVSTPHLDRMARQGAIVEQASTHVPLTRPAHVALFSGQLPGVTGVRDNIAPVRVPPIPLLAEQLQANGFRTGAFVSSIVLAPGTGLERGFDQYWAEFSDEGPATRFLNTAQKPGDGTLAKATAWLQQHRSEERLFLWLHLYDPHDPYEPPEPWASRYPEHPYAGEVAWSDELIGRLDTALDELGLRSKSLRIVTSDHGEGLGEHDERLHGFFAYESTLRIPLLFEGPGIAAGTALQQPASLVDLYPTVLDLLAVDPPADASLSGRSLADALGGGPEPSPAPIYAETLVPQLHFGWSGLRVVRHGSWKYIQAPRPELYDLASDPGELTNLLDRQPRPSEAGALRSQLQSFLDEERRAAASQEEAAPISSDRLAQLGALGYIGGATAAETATPGADPKDKIGEFRIANDRMRRGLQAFQSGDSERAVELFDELRTSGVVSAELHLYLGRALVEIGSFGRAIEEFEESIARVTTYPEAWLGLAQCHLRLGDRERSIAVLQRGQVALPHDASLLRQEGRQQRLLQRPLEVRRAFEAALEIEPNDAFSHATLGEALRDLGEIDRAIESLDRAVELEPAVASYWNALGMTLGGSGRLESALTAFERAVELDTQSHRYVYNLGLALQRMGHAEEARGFFERSLAIDPSFEPARMSLADGSS